jgi:hypothetical protein
MTQKEFEERTGLKLTADNYTEVETCYMDGFPNGTTYKLLVPTSVCINQ